MIALAVGPNPVAATPRFSGSYATPYATGPGSTSVAIGDLNADGIPDVVTANYYGGGISVLIGAEDGSLQPNGDYPTDAWPTTVRLMDLSGDGLLDVAAWNNIGTFSTLLSNGDGTLQPAVTSPWADWQFDDVNGDGAPDLFAFRNDPVVRFNLGGGSFAPPQGLAIPARPVAFGDLSGDRRMDLVTLRYDPVDDLETISIMLGNGDGSFSPGPDIDEIYPDNRFKGAAIGEVNGDGIPDVAVFQADCFRGCPSSSYGFVLLGNGDGTFRYGSSAYIEGENPWFVDLDGDGRGELLSRGPGATFVRKNSGGDFLGPSIAAAWAAEVAFGDLDRDGLPDMATVNGGAHVWVAKGNGDGTFGPRISRALNFNSGPAASGDLNGDGRSDLVIAHGGATVDILDHEAHVILDDGTGTLVPGGPFEVGETPQAVALGDLNGDGQLDLAVACELRTSVLLGDGAGNFGLPTMVASGDASVAIGDLDGDTHNDLVLGSGGTVLRGNGDGTFAAPQAYAPGVYGSVLIGDVNGDGRPDLVLGRGQTVSVMVGGPTGLGPRIDSPAEGAWGLAAGDLNGDGNLDLVTTGTPRLSTMLGDGAGRFSVADHLDVEGLGSSVVGDLNGDGDLDVVAVGGTAQVAIVPGLGDGTLGTALFCSTGGRSPRWVGIEDRNGDDRPDLTIASAGAMEDAGYPSDGVVYSGYGAAVDVLLNQSSGTTPVVVSLANVEVHSDLVRLTWSVENAANLEAIVQRSDAAAGEWAEVRSPRLVGDDRLEFEDRAVAPGARYGYRLVVREHGLETTWDPTWVTIPVRAILSLAGASPNPSENGVTVRLSLPGAEPATLELFDLKGRRVAYREVGSLGAGEHLVPMTDSPSLPAGVYLVRLTQARRTFTAKACLVR
ncbi:MAG TPA: T9SS type A sorting domain-containing protein [Candidatus Eisenbacteria bacterium]|nr:T9SS type A sorting domain-containing protein [Candidatus Eisenbacteria bacterium]